MDFIQAEASEKTDLKNILKKIKDYIKKGLDVILIEE
jgi:hypothetical protein